MLIHKLCVHMRTSLRTDGWTSASLRLSSRRLTVALRPSLCLHRTRPDRTAAWTLSRWSDRHLNTSSEDRPRSTRTVSHSGPSRDASRDRSRSEGTFCRTESGRGLTSEDGPEELHMFSSVGSLDFICSKTNTQKFDIEINKI